MRLRNMRKTALLLAILLLLTATAPAAAATSLYWGSSGEMVRQVQLKLQKWGYLKGAADGVFGQDTYEAVVHFQRKNGLTADGVVGDATFAALGINTSSSSDGQINMEPDAQAVRAAQDAMNGWDPTGGCIYYYNPARTTSSWIYSRTVMTVIGKHYFAI